MNGRYFGVLLLSLVSFNIAALEDSKDRWLLVETQAHVLKVMEADHPLEVFEKIAIGRRGASHFKARGDDKTPLGEYRIGWVNENSRYRRFFGFAYPNLDNAKIALQTGLIGRDTYQSILHSNQAESIPPQNTPLGGQIGIHGLGSANPKVHLYFDWTHGCIAMTNEQIDRLGLWVKKGMKVIIQEFSQNNGGKIADFTAN
jgi:murein L,D-transpeptidase YafK